VLLHLAFLLTPIHDADRMYEVDVGGTQNVLEAAESAGVQQVLVTSSATAYGAFPDNPVPMRRTIRCAACPTSITRATKPSATASASYGLCATPRRVMTIVRPCIVLGPNVDNYIVRLWTEQPFQLDFGGSDNPMQFVHDGRPRRRSDPS